MEDSIIIRNIEVSCLIGINQEEKINPQPIIINLKLFTSFTKASQSDQIEDTVNYSVLVKSVKDRSKFIFISSSRVYSIKALNNLKE